MIDKIIKAADDDLEQLLKDNDFIDPKFTVEQIGLLEDELTDILTKYQDDVMSLVSDYDSVDTLITAINLGSLTKTLIPVFKKILLSTMGNLVDSYLKNIDKDLVFDHFCKGTTDWVTSWSKELSNLIDVGNEEKLAGIFNTALVNGDSIEGVSKVLQDSYLFSPERAKRIAVTEMLSAHSYARFDATMQNPLITKVTWRHSGTKGINARKHHIKMDGVSINKGEKFEIDTPKNGTVECLFPRDSSLPAGERTNCHCTFNEEVDEKLTGLSAKVKKKLQEAAIKEADKLYPW